MHKPFASVISFLFLASCTALVTGCSDSFTERFRQKSFNNQNEASEFIQELKDTGKNGDFHFGFSTCTIPDRYQLVDIHFAGLVDANASNELDILHSKYDHFYMQYDYRGNLSRLSDGHWDWIHLYFYPISSKQEDFQNDRIEFAASGDVYSEYKINFTYKEESIMSAVFDCDAGIGVDFEKITSELIDNFQLVA